MEIRNHVNSLFNSVSYRIGEVLIDPGDEWEGYKGVKAVLLTHAHFDHIYGLNRVAELNPEVRVYTTSFGREMLMSDKKNMSAIMNLPLFLSIRILWSRSRRVLSPSQVSTSRCSRPRVTTPPALPSVSATPSSQETPSSPASRPSQDSPAATADRPKNPSHGFSPSVAASIPDTKSNVDGWGLGTFNQSFSINGIRVCGIARFGIYC